MSLQKTCSLGNRFHRTTSSRLSKQITASRTRLSVQDASQYASQYAAFSSECHVGLQPDFKKPRQNLNGKASANQEERDVFLSVLSTSATKRDAKAYLSRFKAPKSTSQTEDGQTRVIEDIQSVQIALIKLRLPQDASEELLDGLSRTFSQLSQLGLSIVIVLEASTGNTTRTEDLFDAVSSDVNRLESALEGHNSSRNICRLDVLGVTPMEPNHGSSFHNKSSVVVQYPEMLISQLRRGAIPIIPSIGFTLQQQLKVLVDPNEAILSLVWTLSGLYNTSGPQAQADPAFLPANDPSILQNDMSLHKIIILDPLGGLPSLDRADRSHIFVNMEQEYRYVREQLLTLEESKGISEEMKTRHVRNLDLMQQALAFLPSSSSALLTTPQEAATQAAPPTGTTEGLKVGTRHPKNPLIYNLLTDKPLISSSLPAARLGASKPTEYSPAMRSSKSTFVKRGMPLTIIPNPRLQTWLPPKAGDKHLSLLDPPIDFARLLNLIEDSFNRPLDVEDYLNRVRNRIAGVIVAGEYEGGAILTWELPPGVEDDGSEEVRERMVPYLDKFAVLKRSQGAGGVADIVFTAMVHSCFPQGVCWRSRKNNPVNKWYFERAAGSWKIPDTKWTMFWTTENLLQDGQRWQDYVEVCRNVQPSWADNKQVVD